MSTGKQQPIQPATRRSPFIGAPRAPSPPAYAEGVRVYVDWDRNGEFTGAYDDVTAEAYHESRVSIERGRDQIRSLAPPVAGTIEFELNNLHQRYSPDNASSPLSGKLKPGRPVMVTFGYQGTAYTLAAGYVDDLPQYPEIGKRSAGVAALGKLSRLVASDKVYTALHENIRTDEALTILFDYVGIATNERLLDVGKTVLRYWWVGGEDAFSAMKKLLTAEGPGAAIYEDNDGRIVFESRHYRLLNSRSTTPQGSLTATPGANDEYMIDPVRYDPNLKGVFNEAIFTVRDLSIGAYRNIWEQAGLVYLSPNETKSFRILSSTPFVGAITPIAGEDYSVVENSLSSVTLDRTSGTVATLTLVAGALGCTIRDLRVRAQPLETTQDVEVKNTIDAAASISDYGKQTYSDDLLPGISATVAQDLANAVVYIYQTPRPTIELRVIGNASADTRLLLLNVEISDRLSITEPQIGFNNTPMVVETIHHDLDKFTHETTLGLEKLTDYSFAKWDIGIWGTDRWGY